MYGHWVSKNIESSDCNTNSSVQVVSFNMNLKFAANLNFLFNEGGGNIIDKIKLAAKCGFRAVEIPYPECDHNSLRQVIEDSGVEVSLINIALGADDLSFGAASIPGKEEIFKEHLVKTVQLAKSIKCKKIHIMSGKIKGEVELADYLDTYKRNLTYAADYLKEADIVGVIEPINKYALPKYFLNCYEKATSVIRDINSNHLKLLVDIYHLQHIRGNITNSFKEMGDIIGHIQIAQAPHRHEPDVDGELDFSYVFNLIKGSGYDGCIGCEYKPKTTTVDGLKWVEKYGLKL